MAVFYQNIFVTKRCGQETACAGVRRCAILPFVLFPAHSMRRRRPATAAEVIAVIETFARMNMLSPRRPGWSRGEIP
jgi:hypothetical protein